MFLLMTNNDLYFIFFFFNDPATTEIYTLSLHDALPILAPHVALFPGLAIAITVLGFNFLGDALRDRFEEVRSEEHTSELQSQSNLVCRLLLEKKKKISLN